MNPLSIERAPSKVLKNTRNTTTIHDVTTFGGVLDAECEHDNLRKRNPWNRVHRGDKGLKDGAETIGAPAAIPLRSRTTRRSEIRRRYFFSVTAVAILKLFSLRAMHLAKMPLNQPLKISIWT